MKVTMYKNQPNDSKYVYLQVQLSNIHFPSNKNSFVENLNKGNHL